MADVQYVAGVVDGFRGFRFGGHRRFIQPPFPAVANVERQFVENGVHRRGGSAHFRQGAQLADQQGVAAGEVDQKQIVLRQIAAKCGLGQSTVGELAQEGVGDVVLPVGAGLLTQTTINTLGKRGKNHRTS